MLPIFSQRRKLNPSLKCKFSIYLQLESNSAKEPRLSYNFPSISKVRQSILALFLWKTIRQQLSGFRFFHRLADFRAEASFVCRACRCTGTSICLLVQFFWSFLVSRKTWGRNFRRFRHPIEWGVMS